MRRRHLCAVSGAGKAQALIRLRRHCEEPTGPAQVAGPMTSAATKQSNERKAALDCSGTSRCFVPCNDGARGILTAN